jgi:MoxR-like ATPase
MLTDPRHLPPQLPLRRDDSAAGAHYILEDHARLALRMAWATRRPLLVVGEAGCGKTQLAWALACAWQVPLLKHVVHAHTRGEDLLYHFDAVARLADAQVYADLRKANNEKAGDPLDPRHYLRPGPLWWAWNWPDAEGLLAARPPHRSAQAPAAPAGWQARHGSVVLIDEIDKAGVEVPEALLEVLDGGSFDVPWTGQPVQPLTGPDAPSPPLVLITSNGARDLPAPFLRRCIVLAISVPEAGLEAWLQQRARAHFSAAQCDDLVTAKGAEVIAHDRVQARSGGRYVPGVAEYLDLLQAVVELLPGASVDEQISLMEQMAPAVTTAKGKAVAL